MCKEHIHAGAIRKFLQLKFISTVPCFTYAAIVVYMCNASCVYGHGCAYVQEIIHSLKRVDYLPVHTHKPYSN